MVLVTSNKAKQLLYITYIGHITLPELQRSREDLQFLIAELSPGFRVLADFTRLDSMDLDCAEEIGRVMEMVDRRGVGLLVRVIPDPSKDIGMNILTHLHYRNHPQVIACETMAEAAAALGI
jgi:hypothetical protein